MYRFTRFATAKTSHDLAAAAQFGTEVTAYVDKTYGLKMKYGIELFGQNRVHFTWDATSLDKVMEINAKLGQDREYMAMLGKAKHLWVEGTLKDVLAFYPD